MDKGSWYQHQNIQQQTKSCKNGDQMIGNKNCPIFLKVAKTVAKPNIAKIQTMFLSNLFKWKCNKYVAQGIAVLGAIPSMILQK